MIGQNNLISQIKQNIEDNKFPRFSVLVGYCNSGKHDVAQEISKLLGVSIYIILEDCKVDTIRNMITDSYKLRKTAVIVIPDADSMSLSAKNALLKVVEEPPNNIYYIMLADNEDNLLATIKSRARVYYLDKYTKEELFEYYWQYAESKYVANANDAEKVLYCDTPDEIKMLIDFGIDEFFDYVTLVIDNIGRVSGSNSFKITSRLAIKDTDSGYDLALFFKLFIAVCRDRLDTDIQRYAYGIFTTSKYLQDLMIKGINKQALVDCWILDIRKEWLE